MRIRVVLSAGIATALIAGCGDEDFANEPRPPIPIELTGVVQDDAVTVSPARIGAGPVRITISNQTEARQTITLEGETRRTQVGPVDPLDTATIRSLLDPGLYEVSAGSAVALPEEIPPAVLRIGPERRSSSDDLLLP